MRKRYLVICLMMVVLLLIWPEVSAAADIHLFVDGKKVLSDPPPFLAEGRVMLPVCRS